MGVIRFLLALAVVIGHSGKIFGYQMVPGGLAVQAFYMISGFYMALVLNEKYINKDNSYKLFISSRLLRLFPSYWVVLLCTLLFSAIIALLTGGADWGPTLNLYREYAPDMSFLSLAFLIFTNIFIFFQDIVIFLGLNVDTGNLFFTPDISATYPKVFNFLFIPQAWTVGLELVFYIIAPFLVRRKSWLLLTLIALSIFLRFFLIHLGYGNDPKNYRFFPNELALFLLGAVAYKIYAKIKLKELKKNFAILLFVVIIAFTIVYDVITFEYKYITFLVILFIGLPYLFLWTKNMTYDRLIGELSYPIYICHILILTIVLSFKIDNPIFIQGGVCIAVCVLSVLFGSVMNKFIEIPLDKYRQRRIKKYKD